MNIFDVDDRIIHDDADRDDEAGEYHRVESGSQGIQDNSGGEQGEWNGNGADQCRPPLEKECDEDTHDQEAPEQEGVIQVRQRTLDEGGRAKDGGIDLKAWEARLQRVERGFHLISDGPGVSPRLLLDDEQQTWSVVDHRVTDRHRMADAYFGNIAEPNRRPVAEITHRSWHILLL